MSYNDGIRIGGKHSFTDFGLVVGSRAIGYPTKKSVRKTVPFMNGYYDYTNLYGSPAWGERIITYSFDVIGFTVEEMEEERTKVINWLCNVHDEDIYDDAFPDYHFHGSFDSVSVAEDGEQSSLTFSFVCYPFVISNEPISKTVTEDGEITITNNGQQPVALKIATTGAVSVSKGGVEYGVPAGIYDLFTLVPGENALNVAFDNEIVYPYYEGTTIKNGITFTDNGDGSITIAGTATAAALFYVRMSTENFLPMVGQHHISGIPKDNENNVKLYARVYDGSTNEIFSDSGSGAFFNVTADAQHVMIYIAVPSGQTVENLTVTPVLHGVAEVSYSEEVL